jgi:predicted ATPase
MRKKLESTDKFAVLAKEFRKKAKKIRKTREGKGDAGKRIAEMMLNYAAARIEEHI